MENIQSTVARPHADSTSTIRPRRSGVPCVRCRQMKVKCNASQNFPAPCSGCKKAAERCCVDPAFKRTAKRRLKAHPEDAEGDEISRKSRSEASGTEPTDLSGSLSRQLPVLDSSAAHIQANLPLADASPSRFCHEASGVDLKRSVVVDLIGDYFSRQHPKFPLLLDPSSIIESYYEAPLLFWSVLAVASKDSEKHASHHPQLHNSTRQLAADMFLLGTRSIHLVQALLIFYVWSFPHEDMNKEPLSMYCAVAISMARSLGLHRPHHPFRFFAAKASEIGTLEARTITWIYCFIVDQWHTARFGVPSATKIDHVVLQTMNSPADELPMTTKIQLHIATVASKMSAALGECVTSPTGLATDPLPVVRVLQIELCAIQDKYAAVWSPADEVSFLDARLSLYSYVLDQKLPNNKKLSMESLRPEAELITQSSLAASQLLLVLIEFPDTLSKGTFHTFRCASYAVLFLLRILGMAPSGLINGTDIRNVIRQTYTLMRNICQAGDDRRSQCGRICRIIEHMIDYKDWDKDTPFTGKAQSFMANNFIADVAVRGIVRANQRYAVEQAERDGRDSSPPGAPADVNLEFDFDFSTWDPIEWTTNWDESAGLLLFSEGDGLPL